MLSRFFRKMLRRPGTVDGVVNQFNRLAAQLERVAATKEREIKKHEAKLEHHTRLRSNAHGEGVRALAVAEKIKNLIS